MLMHQAHVNVYANVYVCVGVDLDVYVGAEMALSVDADVCGYADVNVNVVFQIWSKNFKLENDKFSCSEYIKIYSVSDGGTPGTTRNKGVLHTCDLYLPTTCFGVENMRLYYDFEDLPQRRGYGIKILKDHEKVSEAFKNIRWDLSSFRSTNGAFNLRFDLIEKSLSEYGIKNP
jgi:hypothetical protein